MTLWLRSGETTYQFTCLSVATMLRVGRWILDPVQVDWMIYTGSRPSLVIVIFMKPTV